MLEVSGFMLNDKKKREGDNPSLFYFVAKNPHQISFVGSPETWTILKLRSSQRLPLNL
jgi:hypothetical protein